MSQLPPISRRRFLRQSFAFSAAAAMLGGCGSGVRAVAPPTDLAPDPVFDPSSHLLMVGDWGEDGTPTNQALVARGMQTYTNKWGFSTDALLMLGDNFYGSLPDTASSRWQTQFETMYPKSLYNCPAYAIPGNHDYQVDPVAKYPVQLSYAQAGASRWTMPSQWYTFMFPQVNPVMKVIALDSNMPFSDGAAMHGNFYAMTEAQRLLQLQYLEDELAKPLTVPFLTVMGHHPLYSDGPHGDNSILIRDWDPLFRQYKVHLYLGGHDHDLQHLEFAGHPTSFFLSGGGGADLYNLATPASARGPYASKVYGFSHIHATPGVLRLRHVDVNGVTLHAFTKAVDGTVTILA
jgi:hypothetical protein